MARNNRSFQPLGLTVTQAAEGLGVSRKTLSALLNGRFGLSAEMAIRLSKALKAVQTSTSAGRPPLERDTPQGIPQDRHLVRSLFLEVFLVENPQAP